MSTLRADLHTHTCYSRDCLTPPEKYVAACLRKGINCVAVTDHNTIQGALIVQSIAPFTVIIGEEIRTVEGEIVGLFLSQEIPKGLTPEETVRCIREQGGLVAVPHPFDRVRRSVLRRDALRRILPHVDIIEAFNARNTLRADNRRAEALARQGNLAMSAGSDAHVPWELGAAHVEMEEFNGPQEFLVSLRQGRIVGHRSLPLVHLFSTWAKLRRRVGGSVVPAGTTAAPSPLPHIGSAKSHRRDRRP